MKPRTEAEQKAYQEGRECERAAIAMWLQEEAVFLGFFGYVDVEELTWAITEGKHRG
jgi:hypothetical protein